MRHRKAGVKLNRTTSHKDAMFRNMVTSLFKYERIRTTDTKAKELRRLADKMVTLAKRGDLHARRQALSVIREKDVVHKLFEIAPERFAEINGGYTRILKMGLRPGDAAPMSIIELVNLDSDKPKKKKSKKAKKAAKAAKAEAARTGAETAPAPAEEAQAPAPPVSDETVAEPVATAGEAAPEPETAPAEDAQEAASADQPEAPEAEAKPADAPEAETPAEPDADADGEAPKDDK